MLGHWHCLCLRLLAHLRHREAIAVTIPTRMMTTMPQLVDLAQQPMYARHAMQSCEPQPCKLGS